MASLIQSWALSAPLAVQVHGSADAADVDSVDCMGRQRNPSCSLLRQGCVPFSAGDADAAASLARMQTTGEAEVVLGITVTVPMGISTGRGGQETHR